MKFEIFIKNETEEQFYERVQERLKNKVQERLKHKINLLSFQQCRTYEEDYEIKRLMRKEDKYKKLINKNKNKSEDKKKELLKKINKYKKKIRKLFYIVLRKRYFLFND